MADALEVQIADAVLGEITANSWSQPITAERHWLPTLQADDLLDTLQVTVVPVTLEEERLTRGGKRQRDYGVAIYFGKLVEVADRVALKAEIDQLTYLAEEVHNYFGNPHRLTGLTDWVSFASERRDLYNLEWLYANHAWETLVIVTVRGWYP